MKEGNICPNILLNLSLLVSECMATETQTQYFATKCRALLVFVSLWWSSKLERQCVLNNPWFVYQADNEYMWGKKTILSTLIQTLHGVWDPNLDYRRETDFWKIKQEEVSDASTVRYHKVYQTMLNCFFFLSGLQTLQSVPAFLRPQHKDALSRSSSDFEDHKSMFSAQVQRCISVEKTNSIHHLHCISCGWHRHTNLFPSKDHNMENLHHFTWEQSWTFIQLGQSTAPSICMVFSPIVMVCICICPADDVTIDLDFEYCAFASIHREVDGEEVGSSSTMGDGEDASGLVVPATQIIKQWTLGQQSMAWELVFSCYSWDKRQSTKQTYTLLWLPRLQFWRTLQKQSMKLSEVTLNLETLRFQTLQHNSFP